MAAAAPAARLPLSTLTVEVLSVNPESFHREEYNKNPSSVVVVETTWFVAKARIVEIGHNEHGLIPGAVIDIRYDVIVRRPPAPMFRPDAAFTLKAGETVTLTAFGNGGSFQWRRCAPSACLSGQKCENGTCVQRVR